MNKLMEKLEKVLNKYLMPVADGLNNNKVIGSIRDGMMMTLPITLISSIAAIFSFFPFLDRIAPNFDKALKNFFLVVSPPTLGLLAVYVIIGAGNKYCKAKKIDSLYGIICAFACFFLVTPFSTTADVIVNNEIVKNAFVSNIIPIGNLGATGVFPALLVTFVSIAIYSYLHDKNFTIKMPESVPENVAKPFLSIIPMGGALLVFLIVRKLFELTSFGNLQTFIDQIVTKPLLGFGNNIWIFLFLLFIAQILWFFGIHGTSLVMTSVWQPIALVAMASNLEAFTAGKPLPYMLTAAFMVYTGQAKLSEIVALATLGKSERAKALSKVALIPALFNIHEPFVFGLPVIMNTTLMIPWMLVESIQAGVAYGLMVMTGAVPIFQAPWTTPPIIQQLIATNFNPWSAVIPIVTFALGFIMWAPFIKLLDKQYLDEEKQQEA